MMMCLGLRLKQLLEDLTAGLRDRPEQLEAFMRWLQEYGAHMGTNSAEKQKTMSDFDALRKLQDLLR
jgi:hypothetical protein